MITSSPTARARRRSIDRRTTRHTSFLRGAALAALLLIVPAVDAPAVSAITCNTATAAPTNTDPGALVLADNFESGTFSRWSTVVHNGDASAYVTGTHHASGWCAGRLHVTSNSGSRAYVQKSFGWQAWDVWASGAFYVESAGWVPNNVPYLRLWNGSRRVLDIYRQNGAGALWLRTPTASGTLTYVKLKSWVALNTWHTLKVHARPAWGSSTVEVWLDGVRVYSNSQKYLPTDNLTSVMIGAEHYRQQMDLYFDDVVIKAR